MADLEELLDQPIRLLHDTEDVLAALVVARAEFMDLLRTRRSGLTVTVEAERRWWPIERYRREIAS